MTKWSQVCDTKLKRCSAYIETTEKFVMESYVNDPIHLYKVAMFSDADFAGDVARSKSATDGALRSSALTLGHRLQEYAEANPASHSSTGSQILALDFVLRSEGVPVLGIWQCLAHHFRDKCGAERPAGAHRVPIMMVFEDNEAVLKTTLKKRSMALRHLLRTHRPRSIGCLNSSKVLRYLNRSKARTSSRRISTVAKHGRH